jgi:hypothetical protein
MFFTLALLAAATEPTRTNPPPAATPVAPAAPEFIVGTDTVTTVTAKLGHPFSEQSSSDGTSVLIYANTRAHATAGSYVPIVGLFAGAAKSRTETKVFVFDKDHVLKSFTTSTSQARCHAGMFGMNCK